MMRPWERLQKDCVIEGHRGLNCRLGCHPNHVFMDVFRSEKKKTALSPEMGSSLALLGGKLATQSCAKHGDW